MDSLSCQLQDKQSKAALLWPEIHELKCVVIFFPHRFSLSLFAHFYLEAVFIIQRKFPSIAQQLQVCGENFTVFWSRSDEEGGKRRIADLNYLFRIAKARIPRITRGTRVNKNPFDCHKESFKSAEVRLIQFHWRRPELLPRDIPVAWSCRRPSRPLSRNFLW